MGTDRLLTRPKGAHTRPLTSHRLDPVGRHRDNPANGTKTQSHSTVGRPRRRERQGGRVGGVGLEGEDVVDKVLLIMLGSSPPRRSIRAGEGGGLGQRQGGGVPRHSLVLSLAPSAWGYLSGPLRQLTRACGPRPTSHASSWQLFQRPTTRRMMTYALLSMSERHGLLAGIMCAGASPVPACAELTQPPAWFFAAVARPCLWAVGVQLPPHLAASASCCVTRRSCCGGSLRRRRPACRGSLASELLSRRGPCRRPGRKSTTAGGTTAKMASCFLICRVFVTCQ